MTAFPVIRHKKETLVVPDGCWHRGMIKKAVWPPANMNHALQIHVNNKHPCQCMNSTHWEKDTWWTMEWERAMLPEFRELWFKIFPTDHEAINFLNIREKSWNGCEHRGDIVNVGVERGIQRNVEYEEAVSKIILYWHCNDHINSRYTSRFEYSEVVSGCFAATVHDSGSDWEDSDRKAFELWCRLTCVSHEGEEWLQVMYYI